MKKFLLLAATVVMALSVSAADKTTVKANVAGTAVKTTSIMQKTARGMKIDAETMQKLSVLRAAKMNAAKAPVVSDLYGSYVEDSYDEANELTECSSVEVSGCDEAVELEDGTILPLNIYFEGMCGGDCNVMGNYNAETGLIVIPAGMTCNDLDEYGEIWIAGLDAVNEGYLCDLELIVGDDGYITLNEEVCNGWYIGMTGDYSNYYWGRGNSLDLGKANGTINFREKHVENGAWTAWAEVEDKVFIEDLGDILFIHNFLQKGVCQVELDVENMTIAIPNMQPMMYGGSNAGVMFLTGCSVDEEGYLNPEYENYDFTTEGELYPSAIAFGTIDQTEGQWDEPNYYYICSNVDEEGYGYYAGFYTTIEAGLDEGVFQAFQTEAIKTVNGAENSAVSYNVLGQKVAKDAKGLVINNGKKYMNK